MDGPYFLPNSMSMDGAAPYSKPEDLPSGERSQEDVRVPPEAREPTAPHNTTFDSRKRSYAATLPTTDQHMQSVDSAPDTPNDKRRKLAAARPHAASNDLLKRTLLANHTKASTTAPALQSDTPEQQSSHDAEIIFDYARRAMEPDALALGSLHVDEDGFASARIPTKESYLRHPVRKIPLDTRKDVPRRDHYRRNPKREFTNIDPRLYTPMQALECFEWSYGVAGNTRQLAWGEHEGLMMVCTLSLGTREKIGTFVERVWGGSVGSEEVAAVAKMALEYSP